MALNVPSVDDVMTLGFEGIISVSLYTFCLTRLTYLYLLGMVWGMEICSMGRGGDPDKTCSDKIRIR